MSSGRDKKKERDVGQQAQTAMAEVKTVSPLQQALDKKTQSFLDWESSSAPKDVTQAPGFSESLDIYGNAEALANQERMGTGAMRLADSNSGYVDKLKQLDGFNRFNTRATGLNDALQNTRAQAYGMAGQSISASDAKKLASANLALQQENSYYNRPQRPGFWGQLLSAGLGVAGAASGLGAKPFG